MNEEREPFDSPPTEPPAPIDETPGEPDGTLPPPPPTAAAPDEPAGTPPPPPTTIRAIPPIPSRPAISTGDYWRARSDDLLVQLGIDARLAARVLIIAVIAGALGALLDEVLSLPGTTLRVSFGGTLVAGLSGLSYAYFKGREDAPGLIMAAVAGLVAYVVWYIVREIVGTVFALNIPKAMVSGALAGIMAFGWLALLREIPKRLP